MTPRSSKEVVQFSGYWNSSVSSERGQDRALPGPPARPSRSWREGDGFRKWPSLQERRGLWNSEACAKFFFYLALGLLGLLALYFLWLVLKAFYSIIVDFQVNRDLDQLADELAAKRRERRERERQRLNNGCDHQFDDALGALPPNVCRKCGIERDPPSGDCDHRWKVQPGIVPESVCAKCGKVYSKIPT